ncbi:hypothetical protein EDD86DRAFT_5788 [Gorgonomyces haynaldii]|nr:hypothetical protein EDD86DRAFT_5788 [Gorgonomyces haynaldii]
MKLPFVFLSAALAKEVDGNYTGYRPEDRPVNLSSIPPTFTTTAGERLFRIWVNDKRVFVLMVKESKRHLVMQFSVAFGPRFGYEWNRNASNVDGRFRADVSFATRPVALIETNPQNGLLSPLGREYYLPQLSWSNIQVTNTTQNGVVIYSMESTGAGPNGSFNVTVGAQFSTVPTASQYGTLRPFGLKYSFNITGSLRPQLNNPTWKLIQLSHASTNAPSDFQNNTIGDSASRLEWNATLVIDGTSTTVTRDQGLNISIGRDILRTGIEFGSRDGKMDWACITRVLSWSLPTFSNSLYWDPAIYINENQAESYADSGAYDPDVQKSNGFNLSGASFAIVVSFLTAFFVF